MYRNYRLFDMAYVSLTSFFFEVRHVIFWGRSLKVLKAALRKSNSVEICEQVVLLTRSCQYSLYPSWIFCLKCDLPWIILPDINRNYVKSNRICERCCDAAMVGNLNQRTCSRFFLIPNYCGCQLNFKILDKGNFCKDLS